MLFYAKIKGAPREPATFKDLVFFPPQGPLRRSAKAVLDSSETISVPRRVMTNKREESVT